MVVKRSSVAFDGQGKDEQKVQIAAEEKVGKSIGTIDNWLFAMVSAREVAVKGVWMKMYTVSGQWEDTDQCVCPENNDLSWRLVL